MPGEKILVLTDKEEIAQQVKSELEEKGYRVSVVVSSEKDGASLDPGAQVIQQYQKSQTLLQISQMLAGSLDLTSTLQSIVDAANTLIGQSDQAVLHLLNKDQTILEAVATSPATIGSKGQGLNLVPGQGIAGLVLQTGKSINVKDATQDQRFIPSSSGGIHLRSLLVVPVMTADKRLGTLSVQSGKPGYFTFDDERLLTTLGANAAVAIEKAQLFETIQTRLKEVNALYNITQGIVESLDRDVILRQVVSLLHEHFNYYSVQVFMIDPERGDLVIQPGSVADRNQTEQGEYRLELNKGIIGHVASTGHLFVTNNTDEVPFFVSTPLLPETGAELAVPLRVGDHIVGVLDIQHARPQQFTDHDLRLLTAVANQVSMMLERGKIYADLQVAFQHEKSARAQMVQSEKLAALGKIVASVAHELNNPLQAIQNALYLVKLEIPQETQSREDLEVATREVGRMTELISRLREAYRPALREDFKPNQVNELVSEVHQLIAAHLRQNNILFEFEPNPNLLPVSLIRDQIKQVMLNICLNAVDVMPNGGKLMIHVLQPEKKGGTLITITDTGPGIPPDVLPFIFDPFFTTKDSGTGLGLAITYDIVQRHKGKIEVESEAGKGTTFTIWLPLES